MVQDLVDGGFRWLKMKEPVHTNYSRWVKLWIHIFEAFQGIWWIQMVQDVVDGGYRWFRM